MTALFLFVLCAPVFAEEQTPPQPSNLTLGNFFSEGWDQAWTKRVTPGGAPDMALLHVQTNFLEREFRTDYYSQQNVGKNTTGNVSFLDGLVAYGINRRFMLAVISNYQWNSSRISNSSKSGAGVALAGRLQLVDVPGASYALNFRVSPPNAGIGGKQTAFTSALAGWHDLTNIGLKRVGLYYSIQEDAYNGPGKAGARHNDLAFDVSLAKTWTDPDVPFAGNLTTFVETYGATDLDGDERGTTVVNATPGVRVTLGHGNVLMGGVDLPVSTPHAFNATYRLTYIYNF